MSSRLNNSSLPRAGGNRRWRHRQRLSQHRRLTSLRRAARPCVANVMALAAPALEGALAGAPVARTPEEQAQRARRNSGTWHALCGEARGEHRMRAPETVLNRLQRSGKGGSLRAWRGPPARRHQGLQAASLQLAEGARLTPSTHTRSLASGARWWQAQAARARLGDTKEEPTLEGQSGAPTRDVGDQQHSSEHQLGAHLVDQAGNDADWAPHGQHGGGHDVEGHGRAVRAGAARAQLLGTVVGSQLGAGTPLPDDEHCTEHGGWEKGSGGSQAAEHGGQERGADQQLGSAERRLAERAPILPDLGALPRTQWRVLVAWGEGGELDDPPRRRTAWSCAGRR
ncbi:unnamed protein product [Prorocentrum cordatum]|uniref:Uncharacterized protein n=1 Tax=Prorocentrum cordatum TaxID=2364126 RepID=A0ABN9Y5J1_9DINO|nr:unnamed protein product [Polarella glacialis]